ncbi:MAG: rhodanese-like domain-containing protein [Pseudomonadota bacterium]
MDRTSPPGSMREAPNANRIHFHRRSVCDARLEFYAMDSREKIAEACLLTAMGTLGITCGFSSAILQGISGIRQVSRGLEPGGDRLIQESFRTLYRQFFSRLQAVPYPFHADLRILNPHAGPGNPLQENGVSLVIGWCMGKESQGMMGLGPKIISDTYSAEEINFLLTLTDTMLAAMQLAEARIRLREVNQDMDRAQRRCGDQARDLEEAARDLDHTRFRLSGFNDIFNELSGLRESASVIDSFLLVLMGIFSAESGYAVYLDQGTQKMHTTFRGLDLPGMGDQTSREVRQGIGNAFSVNRALQMDPMQAMIASGQKMECFKPFVPETPMGIIFKVDEAAMGIIGLGRRLTDSEYGVQEQNLLLAFVKNCLVFLKNSKSFETIERLRQDQEKKNLELEYTIRDLSASRRAIAGLEKAGERIRASIAATLAQSRNVSVRDMVLILMAGIVLGLVYNYASPGGIDVIPRSWLRPAMVHVDLDKVRQLLGTGQALVVDARPTEFFNQGHIKGAVNLPPSLFDFIYMMRFTQIDPGRPIVVYGRTISRLYDEDTAFRLSERGHEKVALFPGGIDAWAGQGGEMEP